MGKTKKEENEPKEQYEERKPILSRQIALSKDKKWLIVKTIRTDIIHMNYMDKVLEERI